MTIKSQFTDIWETAVQQYKTDTGIDITAILNDVDSPETLLNRIDQHHRKFKAFFKPKKNLREGIGPVLNCIQVLSDVVCQTAGAQLPPARAIFSAVWVLDETARSVRADYNHILSMFNWLNGFLCRLKVHTEHDVSPPVQEVLIRILVHVFGTLGLVTKHIKEGRIKQYVKKLAGVDSNIYNAMDKLNQLSAEEGQMAMVANLSLSNEILQQLDIAIRLNQDETNFVKITLEQKIDEACDKLKRHAESIAKRKAVRKWLSAPDPSLSHVDALKKCHPGTGKWLLDSVLYQQWKMEPNSMLWLNGISGSGKTILCSTLIQDVQNTLNWSQKLAFFYFDTNEQSQQTCRGLLCSFISTFYAAFPEEGSILEALHEGNCHFRPTYDMLKNALKEMLSCSQDVYLIVDALDECRELDDVLELIQTIKGWNLANCHILVTSRKEQPITAFFAHTEPSTFVEVDLTNMPVDDDIQVYVTHELSNHIQLQKWGEDGCNLIHDTLTKQANGMFRWVACQLDELKRSSITMNALRLNGLPKTLKETYDNIIERIPEWERSNTNKLLIWVTYGCSPLTLEELASVLEFDDESYSLNAEKKLLHPEDVFLICSSLVKRTVDDKIALAHSSVKEYLSKNILPDSKTCHGYIAKMSIRCVHFDSFPLQKYCSTYWPSHVIAGDLGQNDEITEMLKPFFMPENHSKQLTSYEFIDDEDYLTHVREPGSPLVYATLLGAVKIIRWLLDVDFGTVDLDLNKALLAASHRGYMDIVLLLLDRGADVHAMHEQDNTPAFQYGVYKKHLNILQVLLNRGADINKPGWKGGTALHSGAMYGHVDVIQFLIRNGAEINEYDQRGLTPLHCAAGCGHPSVVQLLINEGADPSLGTLSSGVPLHQASFHGSIQVISCLLDNGACVDPYSEELGTPLQAACLEGHFQLVKLLIERGADINMMGGSRLGNALHAAICGNHLDIAPYLIEQGVQVVTPLVNGRTHLHNAVSKGNIEMVKLLCKHSGSTPEFLDVEGIDGSALELALSIRKFTIANVLLEAGAMLTDQAFSKGIHCATRYHSVLYLEQVMDWKEQYNPELDTSYALSWALADASFDGNIEMVKMLLEKYNVDANVLEGMAVINASHNGHLDVLKVLEAAGGTLSGCEGALQAAACMGRQDTLEHLLSLNEKNPNPNFDVNHCELNDHSALEDALIGGYSDIARMLIEKGADINGQGSSEGVALEMAARRGYADVVKMMLDRGAMNGVQYALEHGVNEGWEDVVRVLLEDNGEMRKGMMDKVALRCALHVARQKNFTEVAEMLKRSMVCNGEYEEDVEGISRNGGGKDEESVCHGLVQQGTMIKKDVARNGANDEGVTETFANGGIALAGLGLLACTFALFYLRRRGTSSD